MMRLYDWLTGGVDLGDLPRPEMDPLTERGALQEAQLIEAHLDAVNRRVGLVIDLRQALQLRTESTALIVFDDVEEFVWVGERRLTRRTAWTIVDSTPEGQGGDFRLFFVPDGELRIRAARARFFSGEVDGLPEAPPDFIEASEEEIAAGMPSIHSHFDVRRATTLTAGPPAG